ncbi:MAG: CDP-alcohol phosphatidyltransferase family protein [Hydrogenobacter thermophilus]|uniref:CDP-alcohol phosphatidyltransferase family protein n=1 Tax=Hydrogenobacter thermophilus TaxID=940 RepID=UPI001C75CD6F|nr:CDP-alcohol phosphatidyltransferase family protein [Hydrogenobacter thermophilus]QWK19134.1 MAG: CDP-alcohol phosphatidyltransferase family protein [Hydrogenobacter thermophilus]
MNLTKRRESLKKVYAPVGIVLYKLHFPPNLITLLSLLLGMASAYAFYHGKLLTASSFLLLSGLFDLADGTVARLSERTSKFGAVFDWIADKWVDGFVLGTVGYFYAGPFTAITAVTASMLHSFIKPVVYSEIGYEARIKGKIKDPLEGVGFFGRPETHITLIIFALFERMNAPFGLSVGIKLIALLTLLSLLMRILYLYKHFGRSYE